jgi:hypothetical protein
MLVSTSTAVQVQDLETGKGLFKIWDRRVTSLIRLGRENGTSEILGIYHSKDAFGNQVHSLYIAVGPSSQHMAL